MEQRLTALRACYYRGVNYQPGHEFEALPHDAKVLVAIGHARTVANSEPEIQTPDTTAPNPEAPPKRRRGRPRKTETADDGTYRRRDLKAEE